MCSYYLNRSKIRRALLPGSNLRLSCQRSTNWDQTEYLTHMMYPEYEFPYFLEITACQKSADCPMSVTQVEESVPADPGNESTVDALLHFDEEQEGLYYLKYFSIFNCMLSYFTRA